VDVGKLGERGVGPREREEEEGRRLMEKLVAERAGEGGAMRSSVGIARRLRRVINLRDRQMEKAKGQSWTSQGRRLRQVRKERSGVLTLLGRYHLGGSRG
jgi:hypothetical protein